MITFTLCLLALIAGYFIYGRFIERVFGPNPAILRNCIIKIFQVGSGM